MTETTKCLFFRFFVRSRPFGNVDRKIGDRHDRIDGMAAIGFLDGLVLEEPTNRTAVTAGKNTTISKIDDIQFLAHKTVTHRYTRSVLNRNRTLNPNLLRSVPVQRRCASGSLRCSALLGRSPTP